MITELKDWYERTEKANSDLGDTKTTAQLFEIKKAVGQSILSKNADTIKLVTENVKDLYFSLTLIYVCIDLIQDYNERYNSLQWKDRIRARQLLDRGLMIINDNPTVQELLPVARELFYLLPDEEKKRIPDGLLRG